MAKSKRITKKDNPYIWKLRSVKNWFYDKRMRLTGYVPTTFSFYDNKYNYEKRSVVDAGVKAETEPVFEKIHYDLEYRASKMINWKNIRAKHKKLKELRNND